MATWDDLAAQKYRIQQQQADTGTLTGQAQARATNVSADLAPSLAKSAIGLQGAQTYQTQTQANLAPGLAAADIAQKGALTTEAGARTGLYNTQSDVQRSVLSPADDNLLSSVFTKSGFLSTGQPSRFALPSLSPVTGGEPIAPPTGAGSLPGGFTKPKGNLGFSEGTARVPGKGDGTKDTVAAKLAPGEAVLNKGAAEHLGRGMVAALNAIGLVKMNMPDEGAGQMDQSTQDNRAKMKLDTGKPLAAKPLPATAGAQAYKKGTSRVAAGKPSDTRSVNPQDLVKIAAMLGGGGMPGGGGASAPRGQ